MPIVDPEGQRLLETEPTKKDESSFDKGKCLTCLKVGGAITGVVVLLLLLLLLRISTAECAIEGFDNDLLLLKNAKEAGVPEPFDRGTEKNMDLDDLDTDLKGVWWMDGNPLTVEQLVSFASAKGKKPFPSSVPVYNNMARRWTWTDNIAGRIVMAYYAVDAKPDSPLVFNFTNKTSARIIPVGGVNSGKTFGFQKISDNEWDRPDANYVLRRIVNADGTAGPFWKKFKDWYKVIAPNGRMLVWRSDSDCLRKCQYFAPCFLCDAIC